MRYEMTKCEICGKLIRKKKTQSNLKYCCKCIKEAHKKATKKYHDKIKSTEKYLEDLKKNKNNSLMKDIADADKLGISYGEYISKYKYKMKVE